MRWAAAMLALTLALIALDACKGPRLRLRAKPREAHRMRFERPHTPSPRLSGERVGVRGRR